MVIVERGLDLLFLFRPDQSVWTVPEMALSLGMPASTLYRYVRSLKERGLLEEDRQSPGGYRLGPRVLELAQVYSQTTDLGRVSRPVMRELADLTGESVMLMLARDLHGYCIEAVESRRSLRLSFEIGHPLPLHAGASMKILLAYLDEATFRAVVQAGLTRYTQATITDPERLRAHMTEIRRQGWAFSDGEVDEWARAVAAPVRNSRGVVVAGLSLAGPSQRLADEHLPGLVAQVKAAADRISTLVP